MLHMLGTMNSDYKVEGNELILTMNRVGLYTMVNQFITTKNDAEMEYSYDAAFSHSLYRVIRYESRSKINAIVVCFHANGFCKLHQS